MLTSGKGRMGKTRVHRGPKRCIFVLFDAKQNGHIDFREFVQTLSIFHPRTPESEKIAYAFKLYDLRHTGYIEREELKEMVLALLDESDLHLSDDVVEAIVDRTFKESDTNGDGRIDQEEWREFATRNPMLLRNMALPYLVDVNLALSWAQEQKTQTFTG